MNFLLFLFKEAILLTQRINYTWMLRTVFLRKLGDRLLNLQDFISEALISAIINNRWNGLQRDRAIIGCLLNLSVNCIQLFSSRLGPTQLGGEFRKFLGNNSNPVLNGYDVIITHIFLQERLGFFQLFSFLVSLLGHPFNGDTG